MLEIIHETQIFAPIAVYSSYVNEVTIHIEACENYQKRSYRNRFDILTANGVMPITIPLVKGKNNRQLIKNVMISYDENWVIKVLHAIRSAYGKSPYFEYYFEDLENLFFKKPKYLFDFNMTSLAFVLKKLKMEKDVKNTNDFNLIYTDIKDFRNFNWKTLISETKYIQVWNEKFDFIPNLSILDLLFCVGPESTSILRKMNSEFIIKDH